MDLINYDFESAMEQGFKTLFNTAGIDLHIADDVDDDLPDENVRLDLSVGSVISDEHLKDSTIYDNYGGALEIEIQSPRVDYQVAKKRFNPIDISGASAAYSLRNLSSSYTGSVVEVRRSSDGALRSFTAAEVTDGTLVAWVNEDVISYTSDFSAGNDGWLNFSQGALTSNIDGIGGLDDNLRFTQGIDQGILYNNNLFDLGSEYTISVDYYFPSSNTNTPTAIDFRFGSSVIETVATPVEDTWNNWSVSGALSHSAQLQIRPADLATGDLFYIRNVVITETTADGTVSKWYDQSGNANDATQVTTTAQPKIVSGGSLVAGGIDFDGVDDFFALDLGADLAQPNSIFMVHESDTTNYLLNEFLDVSGTPRTLLDQAGPSYRMFAGISDNSGLDIVANQKALVGAFYDSTSSFLSKDGAVSSTFDVGTDGIDSRSNIGKSQTRCYDGKMDEFIIYNSDQSANRLQYEYDIANYYGIEIGIDTYKGERLFNSRHTELVATARKAIEEIDAAVLATNWPGALSPTKIKPTGTERDNDAEHRVTKLSYDLQFRIT